MRRFAFFVLVGLIGFAVTALLVFQVAFVAAVLPHGGLY